MRRKDITTIQVSKETRVLLMRIGRKGETYDQIIRRLIKQAYGEEALNVENPHTKSSPADEVGSVEEE